jgi:hypothetical protein
MHNRQINTNCPGKHLTYVTYATPSLSLFFVSTPYFGSDSIYFGRSSPLVFPRGRAISRCDMSENRIPPGHA